jgi:hypothetical protein
VALDMPRVASGLAIEAAWATAHLVMYPFGLLSRPLVPSLTAAVMI